MKVDQLITIAIGNANTDCVTPTLQAEWLRWLNPGNPHKEGMDLFGSKEDIIVRGFECLAKYKRQQENRARAVCIWENTVVKASRSRRSCCVRTQTADVERAQTREGAGPGPRMLPPPPPPLPRFFLRRVPAGRLASLEGPREFLWVTLSAGGR